jgi:hypothetical protein
MPVHHSKIDSRGMARIYKAIIEGPYPVALAPEGQVSYTTDSVPRLEPGVIRIGFSAAEKLAKSAKPVPLEILPVAVHFRFGPWGKFTLKLLLKKIEKSTGRQGTKDLPFSERLKRCREHILEANEKRYNLNPDPKGNLRQEAPGLSFEERLDAVIDAALEAAERIVGVNSTGDVFARMYSLRQICWDRIILPGMDTLDSLSKVQRGVTDLLAGEAWHASRHLELVDFAWYFRSPLPADDAPLHHKIEYAQNLWDFANRTMGGAYADRISIFPRRVVIKAGPPINLTDRLSAYKADRKTAVDTAMADLMKAYLDCIDEVNKTEPEFGGTQAN